ncbi:glycosyltransferase, partial [Candidatus Roizmanbacteria bacterium]|nr:glycosyltransferase [Candidatus Roizmanbacteria bacterium]
MMDNLYIQLYRYLQYHPFLIPLGVIGTWRWSVWGIKRTCAFFYKPKRPNGKSKRLAVSVVTPVYNENPKVFLKAIASWQKNKPHEIIAVVDYTDKACIRVFEKFAETNPTAKLIVTKEPGKRPALADGIQMAKGDIVALVDSDTIWTRDVLKNALSPFADKKIGGVGTKQSVVETKTLAQKLFSIRLEQRYWDEVPFLARTGHVQSCLSGRTAFYRRSVVVPLLHQFVHERFLGEKVISGEDKRLTYLVEEKNWRVTYQSTAEVSTAGVKEIKTFLKQQVRWTRNSWRADLRALAKGWVFKRPIFAAYLIDRVIQPFTLLLSPIYFAVSLVFGLWVPAAIIFAWWHFSRGIKMIPHLKKHPRDIAILPAFILFNFATAYIRIYALFTLNHQSWITRWDKRRLPKFSYLRLVPAYAGTFMLVLFLTSLVYFYKEQTYLVPLIAQKQYVAKTLPEKSNLILAHNSNVLGVSTAKRSELAVKKHEVKEYESLGSIAFSLNVNPDTLLFANASKITNLNYLDPGIVLNVPPKSASLLPTYKFNYQRWYPDFLRIGYDPQTKTTTVAGRAKQVTLADIKAAVGEDVIKEVSPKVWYLKSSVYLASGMTLRLHKNEVTWLKLASNKKGFVTLTAFNATVLINGVRITSWDEQKKTYDKDYKDGRSYIMVKDGSRMDVVNSEIAYLGYPRSPNLHVSPYGISWKMSKGKLATTILTGDVLGSKFHNNYFGAYTFGATGMTFRGNEFYENVRYG